MSERELLISGRDSSSKPALLNPFKFAAAERMRQRPGQETGTRGSESLVLLPQAMPSCVFGGGVLAVGRASTTRESPMEKSPSSADSKGSGRNSRSQP